MNYKVHYWDTVKDAVNNINNKHRKKVGLEPVDYVKNSGSTLPSAISAMMALECSKKTPYTDPDLAIIIDAYNQLEDVGYIGKQVEDLYGFDWARKHKKEG